MKPSRYVIRGSAVIEHVAKRDVDRSIKQEFRDLILKLETGPLPEDAAIDGIFPFRHSGLPEAFTAPFDHAYLAYQVVLAPVPCVILLRIAWLDDGLIFDRPPPVHLN